MIVLTSWMWPMKKRKKKRIRRIVNANIQRERERPFHEHTTPIRGTFADTFTTRIHTVGVCVCALWIAGRWARWCEWNDKQFVTRGKRQATILRHTAKADAMETRSPHCSRHTVQPLTTCNSPALIHIHSHSSGCVNARSLGSYTQTERCTPFVCLVCHSLTYLEVENSNSRKKQRRGIQPNQNRTRLELLIRSKPRLFRTFKTNGICALACTIHL